MPDVRGRFAPSTTGRAHPGTLVAALLCWLDARSRDAEVLLRLEDLDRERTKAGYVDFMVEDPETFTTAWSARVTYQRENGPLQEVVCAENNRDAKTGLEFEGMPVATKLDF